MDDLRAQLAAFDAAHETLGTDSLARRFKALTDFEEAALPARDWVIGRYALNRYITILTGAGGSAKSTLAMAMAVSVATGENLLGHGFDVARPRNVAIINNEDDETELARRLHGICRHYGIETAALDNRLFMLSGYQNLIRLVIEMPERDIVAAPIVEELIGFIQDKRIELLVGDPFATLHGLDENDNRAINGVIGVMRAICARAGVAFVAVSHNRKGAAGETQAGEVTAARGAKALTDGARIVCTLGHMGKETAKRYAIDDDLARRLIRIDDAKMNFSLKDADARWLKLHTVHLANGDAVGVPEVYDIEPHLLAADDRTSGKRMTGTGFAELIEKAIDDPMRKAGEFQFSHIKERIVQASDYRRSAVEGFVTLLSQNRETPTRIKPNGGGLVDYWISKPEGKRTAPWTIHRQELN